MQGTTISSEAVSEGLRRLRAETFAEGALGFGAQEVVSTSVIHQAWSHRTEDVRRDGVWGFRDGFIDFSRESMGEWLKEVRRETYAPGAGTWTSCKVYIYPDAEGSLETFDYELIERDSQGQLTKRPANALTLFQDLKAFPRTVDNIPQWMWEVFRAANVTPPVYNAELKTVEWANKRLPVTEQGTDFTVDPVVLILPKSPGCSSGLERSSSGAEIRGRLPQAPSGSVSKTTSRPAPAWNRTPSTWWNTAQG